MTKVDIKKLHNPIEIEFNTVTRYHYLVFLILFVSRLPMFWHILNLIFLSPPMDYYCNSTMAENSTEFFKNKCPCSNPIWDRSVFTETMQTKFSIYCENVWLVSFSQSVNYFGLLIGSLVFGFLSDKYGRLCMLTLCCLILSVSGCLVGVMPTIASYIIMRCFEGISTGGASVTAYVLCIEYCGVGHREIITALFHIPINLGHLTLPGVSYLLRHCDEFQLALSIPIFFFISMKWIIMESPKWLLDSGKLEEAIEVMEKIAKFNKTTTENIREELETFQEEHARTAHMRIKFWQIFKHKKLSLSLICMSIIYFLCGLGYYGVSQYIGKMSGNIHKNVAISGAIILPGTIASIFLLEILNRRSFLMSTTFLSGLFIIIAVCIPPHNWARVLIACICNCFFFVSFIIVYLYSVELFPTSVRNSVLGMLSVMSRIGQIVSPQINSLPDAAFGSVFGVISLIGTVMCYFLPETKNAELPSSLEDSKMLSRKKHANEEPQETEPNLNIS